jgi:hypothetical protein
MDQNVKLSLDVVKTNTSDIRLGVSEDNTSDFRVKGISTVSNSYLDYIYVATIVLVLLVIFVVMLKNNCSLKHINYKTDI